MSRGDRWMERRSRWPGRAAGLVIIACSWGCADDAVDCSLIGAPQAPVFSVFVRDSVTQEPTWWGADVRIEDGAFLEVLRAPSDDPADSTTALPFFSQSAEVGVYSVHVAKSGYEPWVKTGMVVRVEGCFLTAHVLEADLVRAP